jgi:hypothetical protein
LNFEEFDGKHTDGAVAAMQEERSGQVSGMQVDADLEQLVPLVK